MSSRIQNHNYQSKRDPEIQQIHLFADNVFAIKTIHDPKLCRGQLLVTRTARYAFKQRADGCMQTHQEMSTKIH